MRIRDKSFIGFPLLGMDELVYFLGIVLEALVGIFLDWVVALVFGCLDGVKSTKPGLINHKLSGAKSVLDEERIVDELLRNRVERSVPC